MKKFVVLGVTGAIIAGGYTGLWHYNAGHLKNDVQTAIEKLNPKGQEALKVASIGSSGFPGNITVALKDLNLNIANVFKIHADTYNVTRGIFANSFSQNVEGDLAVTIGPILTSKKPLEFILKSSNDAKLTLNFKGSQFVNFLTGKMSMNPAQGKELKWEEIQKFNLDTLKELKRVLADDFQSIENKSSSSEVVEKASGKTVFRSGPTHIKLAVDRIDEHSHKIALQYSAVDQEFTADMGQVMKDQMKDLMGEITKGQYSATDLVIHNNMLVAFDNMSKSGKSNADIDITYKGPTNLEVIGTKDIEFDLEIAKAESSNKLASGKSHGRFLAKIGKDKALKAGSINYVGDMTVTEEYTQLMKDEFKKMGEMMAAAPSNVPGQNPAAMFKHMDRLFPNLHALGEIKYVIDVKFDGEKKTFDINNVSFLTDKYGFIVKANGDMSNLANPKAQSEITIKNHEGLVSKLFDYGLEVLEAAKEENPAIAAIQIDPSLKKKIVEFLEKIADKHEANSKDLTIKLSVDGAKIKVGEMDGAEALMTLMMLMGGK